MEGYLGEIRLFGGMFTPKNWAYCNGTILPVSTNQALFAIVGPTYGGNGQTTFALPDLLGRTAVGAGEGPGTSDYELGTKVGAPTVTLDVAQIPVHTHSSNSDLAGSYKLLCNTSEASTDDPDGAYLAIPDSGMPYSLQSDGIMGEVEVDVKSSTIDCLDTGGGIAHNNMQPFLATNYIICINGEFPARN